MKRTAAASRNSEERQSLEIEDGEHDDRYALYTQADWSNIRRALGIKTLTPKLVRRILQSVQVLTWTVYAEASERRAEERSKIRKVRQLAVALEDCLRDLAPAAAKILQNVRTDKEEEFLNYLSSLPDRADEALDTIPSKGKTPSRARRSLVWDLATIFKEVTGNEPTLAYDPGRTDKYYSRFRSFVTAVMRPFPALIQGVDDDIRKVTKAREELY